MNSTRKELHMNFTVYIVSRQSSLNPKEFEFDTTPYNPLDLRPNPACIPVLDEDGECMSYTFHVDIPKNFDSIASSSAILDEQIQTVRDTCDSEISALTHQKQVMG